MAGDCWLYDPQDEVYYHIDVFGIQLSKGKNPQDMEPIEATVEKYRDGGSILAHTDDGSVIYVPQTMFDSADTQARIARRETVKEWKDRFVAALNEGDREFLEQQPRDPSDATRLMQYRIEKFDAPDIRSLDRIEIDTL